MFRSQENRIRTFDQELFSNMPRLQQLNLSLNLLDDLMNETFDKNEELLSLDISFNEITSFNELTFIGLEVLEVSNVIKSYLLVITLINLLN